MTSSLKTKSGEGYIFWSQKMKEHLISEGLWDCVEEGCKKLKHRGERKSVEEIEEVKQEKLKNAKALSLIQQSLPPFISMKILDASTAKDAWDTLHSMFQAFNQMDEKADEPTSNENGVIPLSGNKPFFHMLLMESALKPHYNMKFPQSANSILPSTNMVAKVRLFDNKIHEVYFFGKKTPKSFGTGWRQLLDHHDMRAGDFLVLEITKNSDTELDINMQIVKPSVPPEMEEEMRKREITPQLVINNVDDDDANE